MTGVAPLADPGISSATGASVASQPPLAKGDNCARWIPPAAFGRPATKPRSAARERTDRTSTRCGGCICACSCTTSPAGLENGRADRTRPMPRPQECVDVLWRARTGRVGIIESAASAAVPSTRGGAVPSTRRACSGRVVVPPEALTLSAPPAADAVASELARLLARAAASSTTATVTRAGVRLGEAE